MDQSCLLCCWCIFLYGYWAHCTGIERHCIWAHSIAIKYALPIWEGQIDGIGHPSNKHAAAPLARDANGPAVISFRELKIYFN